MLSGDFAQQDNAFIEIFRRFTFEILIATRAPVIAAGCRAQACRACRCLYQLTTAAYLMLILYSRRHKFV